MIIIGITGSIGCGKTYLANIIKKMGCSNDVKTSDDKVKLGNKEKENVKKDND